MNGIVRRGPDGSLTWRAEGGEAFLSITVQLGQITLTVDAAFPDEPVEVVIGDVDNARETTVFADSEAVGILVAAADGAGVAAPVLSAPLIRLMTVTAVDALHLGDLDDAVVLLEVAYARVLLGDPGRDWYLALASSVSGRLVSEIEATDHLGPLVGRLAEVIGVISNDVPDAETNGLLSALEARAGRANVLWEGVFTELDGLAGLSVDLGAATEAVLMQVADLNAVPTRLLRFDGPEEPEVEVHANPDGSVEVSAPLREGVDAQSAVTEGVFAVAADGGSGELLAFSPATTNGDRITARIDGAGDLGDGTRFAFVGAHADLEALRLDPFGVAMTRVDRHFRYAWTRHRTADAILAGLGIADSDQEIGAATVAADVERQAATESVEIARMLLRQFARRYRAPFEIAVLDARGESVERLAERLREPPTDGPDGTTLTELHMIAFR